MRKFITVMAWLFCVQHLTISIISLIDKPRTYTPHPSIAVAFLFIAIMARRQKDL